MVVLPSAASAAVCIKSGTKNQLDIIICILYKTKNVFFVLLIIQKG
jgi:hypothetical protein